MRRLILAKVASLATLLLVLSIVGLCGCDRAESKATPKSAQEQEIDNLQAAMEAAMDAAVQEVKAPATVVVTNVVTITNTVTVPPRPAAAADDDEDEKKAEQERKSREPSVDDFSGNIDRVRIEFSHHPDLSVLNEYVKFSPPVDALTRLDIDGTEYEFRGAFKPRTKYTVTVREGCPMLNGRKLAKEFRRTFTTGDHRPKVEFAANGRYLPSSGRRAIAVKTMNVTNLFCEIRSVPTKNIVQLLAREEDRYRSYYGGSGDSARTSELADDPVEKKLRLKAKLNESATTVIPMQEGKVANGVYLVGVRAEEKPSQWEGHWRLVCVTDIGLSVRRIGNAVNVWATSLTTGQPMPGLKLSVFGANGIEQSAGMTDAEGWCCCECAKGELAFAVVAEKADASDVTFLALGKMSVEDPVPTYNRRELLKNNACEAFVWTDRGIYRHGEKVLVQAILRSGRGKAPKPFPVEMRLLDSQGRVVKSQTQVSDSLGTVTRTDFVIPEEAPSGTWELQACTPGKDGIVLGAREIKVEEFVPPQIRVKAVPPAEGTRATSNIVFTVEGEHLFGGPAAGLSAEGAYMFEDAPFKPRGWEAFRFGNANRSLSANFKKLDRVRLDAKGCARFTAAFPETMHPSAAVKLTVQGCVFEGGGRPAAARASTVLHAYPYYIGVALPESVRVAPSPRMCRVVVVNPDGTPKRGARRLVATFEQIETVYGLKRGDGRDAWEWRSDTVRHPFGEEVKVEIGENGLGNLPVPVKIGGDFAVTVREESTDISFAANYWVGGTNDEAVRAPLENPSRVALSADKDVYYPGERPRITVKSPFTGVAWLTVMRDEMLYSQVIRLEKATSEIELEPVKATWAPGVDVALSVVQAVKPGPRQVANRALGYLPIRCTTHDSKLDVAVQAKVATAPTGGASVTVDVTARAGEVSGKTAVVTVVDEGINLLTDEKTPDPAGWFGETRAIESDLYDVFNRLLPILEGGVRRAGAKTGGGADGDLFSRVSPVPSRRYKPLSLWKLDVPLTNGQAQVVLDLPEFVGEVRVTAVAYNARGTGAGSTQVKVTPKLVAQPDAPRFAAPGDTFLATLTLTNRSGQDGVATYDLLVGGSLELRAPVHCEIRLAKDASETLSIPVHVTQLPGQSSLIFVSEGFGEKHRSEIELPVRPAAAWMKTATTICLKPGEKRVFPNTAAILPENARRTFRTSGSPVAELASALEYLVGYPYGCLEQTTSRVFPLVTAGGILNTLPIAETTAADDAKSTVATGIRRVCGMVRENDFSMWSDDRTPPWDREVSLWSAHFLVEAQANGFEVPSAPLNRVKGFLRTWAMSTNATVSVYACQILSLAGTPDRDRQLHWFDHRMVLRPLDVSRLARAFKRSGDATRAKTLLEGVVGEPADVRSAAFELLARLDVDPKDPRLEQLANFLIKLRDASCGHWGTTASNAHVLLALGSYYRARVPSIGVPDVYLSVDGGEERRVSPKRAERLTGGGDVTVVNRGEGDSFVSVTTLALPNVVGRPSEAKGISVSRRFLRTDGSAAAPDSFVRGEMLIVEVTLSAPMKTLYADLVLEELLPACFEPDQTPLASEAYPFIPKDVHKWLLRREVRDDRVLGFSRRFPLDTGASVKFVYPVRVVGAGEFVLPGSSVEAMYDPSLHARGTTGRVKVAK